MQAGAYDTVLILFCFSFFPLPLRSISMLQPLFFFLSPPCLSFPLRLSVSLSFSLPPSLPSSLSLSVSSGADTTYGLLVASCSLFFEKTDPLITCNHIFSLARASSKNG